MSGERVDLLDVNLLLALGWHNHQHHQLVNDWMLGRNAGPWATCSITECGFLRIAANPRLSAGAGGVDSALIALKALRARDGHQFWTDVSSPCTEPLMERLQGHNQITDAHLLALAIGRGGRLVTLDHGLAAFAADAGLSRHAHLLATR